MPVIGIIATGNPPSMDSSHPARTIEHALDLLMTAASVLGDAPSASKDAFPRLKIAKLVERARVRLEATEGPGQAGFASGILACNEILDDALRLAEPRSETATYQTQAISAIERSQAILYYLAFRSEPHTPIAKPLSMRPRSLRPQSHRPESEPSLSACSAEELDALLRESKSERPSESDGPELELSAAESDGPELELRTPESDGPELEVSALEADPFDPATPIPASEPPPSKPSAVRTPVVRVYRHVDTAPIVPERNHLWLRVEITFDGPSNFYLGFDDDIALGGLFLSTYNRQVIGTLVGLSVTLPNGHVVLTRGTVRWVRDVLDPNEDSEPGFGVRFDTLSPEDRAAIEAFIRIRSPMFHDDEP